MARRTRLFRSWIWDGLRHMVSISGSAMTALLLGFTVVPALTMAVAVVFQRRYRLDDHVVRS